ncbi:MAG: hypothetical protein AAGF60_13825 [Pseudomonadota bacterium]
MRLAALLICLAAPALAGPKAQPELPASLLLGEVLPDLPNARREVETIRGWHVDWERDGAPEILAQIAYVVPGGGNAVDIKWFLIGQDGNDYFLALELNLPGPIGAVYDTPGRVALDVFSYAPGDPRCCPSGTVRQWIAKP